MVPPFDDPIPLPHGRQLITLLDAGNYIATCRARKLKAITGRPRLKR
jgi:hypothetical protein